MHFDLRGLRESEKHIKYEPHFITILLNSVAYSPSAVNDLSCGPGPGFWTCVSCFIFYLFLSYNSYSGVYAISPFW